MKKAFHALSALALATAASAASAAFVNIGGLQVATDAHFEVASIYENVITGVGQELKGVGEVTQINGTSISNLCAGCELTYSFSNYIVTALTPTQVNFTGGIIKFYLGFGGQDFNPFTSANSAQDLAAATDGTLFLTLAGHPVDALGNTFIGQGANIGLANPVGNGSGLADVVVGGGIATANFNSNSIASAFGGPSDIQIGSSFSNVFVPHPSECPAGPLCLSGSADIRGLVIPEPSSTALVGVALLGLGLATMRRRKS